MILFMNDKEKRMNTPKLRLVAVLAAVFLAVFTGQIRAGGKTEQSAGQNTSTAVQGQAKYVFLFIGDGMATPQITSAEIYSNALSSKDINIQKLAFTKFPCEGSFRFRKSSLSLPFNDPWGMK